MRHKHKVKSRKLKVLNIGMVTLLTFAFSLSTATAQESLNTTGGNVSGSGGSAIYSIGQQRWHTQQAAESTQAELKTYVPRAGIYQATRNGQN